MRIGLYVDAGTDLYYRRKVRTEGVWPHASQPALGRLVLYLKDGTGCVLHLPLAQVCTALTALPGDGSARCL